MENPKDVPYIVYEGTVARFERIIKRMIIVIIVLIISIVAIVAMWTVERSSYDYSDVTVDSTDSGYANYIGQDGAINNAEGGSAETNQEE